MRVCVFLAAALCLAACATPPTSHAVTSSETYNKSKDAVWNDLIAFFTTNNIQVKTIEKDSGVIYAEQASALGTSYADCGNAGVDLIVERRASLNVFVREVQPTTTQVTVNTSFNEQRQDGWTGHFKSVPCTSTGGLESSVLAALR